MNEVLWVLFGCVLGGTLGVILMAIMRVGSMADRHIELMNHLGKLPNSLPEKKRSDIEDEYGCRVHPRWMFVHELQKLLLELEPDDWVRPNDVRNLAIGREIDGEYENTVGAINFYFNEVEWYLGDEAE